MFNFLGSAPSASRVASGDYLGTAMWIFSQKFAVLVWMYIYIHSYFSLLLLLFIFYLSFDPLHGIHGVFLERVWRGEVPLIGSSGHHPIFSGGLWKEYAVNDLDTCLGFIV
jgi:hypothetical protein